MSSDHNEYDDGYEYDDYHPSFILKAVLTIALFSPFILFGIYGILRH